MRQHRLAAVNDGVGNTNTALADLFVFKAIITHTNVYGFVAADD